MMTARDDYREHWAKCAQCERAATAMDLCPEGDALRREAARELAGSQLTPAVN